MPLVSIKNVVTATEYPALPICTNPTSFLPLPCVPVWPCLVHTGLSLALTQLVAALMCTTLFVSPFCSTALFLCVCQFCVFSSFWPQLLLASHPMAAHLSTVPALCSTPDVPMYVKFSIQEVASTSLFALLNLIFLLLLTHLPPIIWRSCWEEPMRNTCCQTFPYGFTELFYTVHATLGENLDFPFSSSIATMWTFSGARKLLAPQKIYSLLPGSLTEDW